MQKVLLQALVTLSAVVLVPDTHVALPTQDLDVSVAVLAWFAAAPLELVATELLSGSVADPVCLTARHIPGFRVVKEAFARPDAADVVRRACRGSMRVRLGGIGKT